MLPSSLLKTGQKMFVEYLINFKHTRSTLITMPLNILSERTHTHIPLLYNVLNLHIFQYVPGSLYLSYRFGLITSISHLSTDFLY